MSGHGRCSICGTLWDNGIQTCYHCLNAASDATGTTSRNGSQSNNGSTLTAPNHTTGSNSSNKVTSGTSTRYTPTATPVNSSFTPQLANGARGADSSVSAPPSGGASSVSPMNVYEDANSACGTSSFCPPSSNECYSSCSTRYSASGPVLDALPNGGQVNFQKDLIPCHNRADERLVAISTQTESTSDNIPAIGNYSLRHTSGLSGDLGKTTKSDEFLGEACPPAGNNQTNSGTDEPRGDKTNFRKPGGGQFEYEPSKYKSSSSCDSSSRSDKNLCKTCVSHVDQSVGEDGSAQDEDPSHDTDQARRLVSQSSSTEHMQDFAARVSNSGDSAHATLPVGPSGSRGAGSAQAAASQQKFRANPSTPVEKALAAYSSEHFPETLASAGPSVNCSICLSGVVEESDYSSEENTSRGIVGCVVLRTCGHQFHTACLLQTLAADGNSICCPNCKTINGTKTGTQPKDGTMDVRVNPFHLPGFRNSKTITITYNFPRGIQGPEHPNPGRPYYLTGFPRTAYLPNTSRGKKVLRLLREAFNRRLIFTVGFSASLNQSDCVVWNDVHHKTEAGNSGGHGYPDPNYLDNVTMELAALGVTENSCSSTSSDEVFDDASSSSVDRHSPSSVSSSRRHGNANSSSPSSHSIHATTSPHCGGTSSLDYSGATPNNSSGASGATSNYYSGASGATPNYYSGASGATPNYYSGASGAAPNYYSGASGATPNHYSGASGAVPNYYSGASGATPNHYSGASGAVPKSSARGSSSNNFGTPDACATNSTGASASTFNKYRGAPDASVNHQRSTTSVTSESGTVHNSIVSRIKQSVNSFFIDESSPDGRSSPASIDGPSRQIKFRQNPRNDVEKLLASCSVEAPPSSLVNSTEKCSLCVHKLEDEGPAQAPKWTARDLVGVVMLANCGHAFHCCCLIPLLSTAGGSFGCPVCRHVHGTVMGKQPKGGKMKWTDDARSLPGYEGVGSIVITYNLPRGQQGPEHPHPGAPYVLNGFPRRAYLPRTSEGKQVCSLLKKAFDRRLVFTVGYSASLGRDDCVTWDKISHKTSVNDKNFGYPDPNYLDNVLLELAALGVKEHS